MYIRKIFREANISYLLIHGFFIGNARLKMAKKLRKYCATPFATEKYSHSTHQRYHPKIIGHILNNKQNNKSVCIDTISNNENEDENEK